MNFIRHHGLDLPVYHLENVHKSKEEYRVAAKSGQSDFVRLVNTSGPDTETLSQRLRRFGEDLKRLSDLCQLQPVEHSWGLCRTDTDTKDTFLRVYEDVALPAGYLLVARVAVICQVVVPDTKVALLREGFAEGLNIYMQATEQNSFRDIQFEDTVYGYPVVRGNVDPELWYVDIEPRMGRKEIYLADNPGFTNAKIIIE